MSVCRDEQPGLRSNRHKSFIKLYRSEAGNFYDRFDRNHLNNRNIAGKVYLTGTELTQKAAKAKAAGRIGGKSVAALTLNLWIWSYDQFSGVFSGFSGVGAALGGPSGLLAGFSAAGFFAASASFSGVADSGFFTAGFVGAGFFAGAGSGLLTVGGEAGLPAGGVAAPGLAGSPSVFSIGSTNALRFSFNASKLFAEMT